MIGYGKEIKWVSIVTKVIWLLLYKISKTILIQIKKTSENSSAMQMSMPSISSCSEVHSLRQDNLFFLFFLLQNIIKTLLTYLERPVQTWELTQMSKLKDIMQVFSKVILKRILSNYCVNWNMLCKCHYSQ